MRTLWLVFSVAFLAWPAFGGDKRILLIAGKPSHGSGEHEFRAGCLLLHSCLDKVPGISSVVYSNGWPQQAEAFDHADAVLIYADGGAANPAIEGNHAKVLGELVKQGVGLGFAHYAVEVPSTNGGAAFLDWVGGYYEDHFSVNPMWSPDFRSFPAHPVARGVAPFSVRDEWYFNLRFQPESKQDDASPREGKFRAAGMTPILHAMPSDAVRKGPYVYPRGPYEHVVAASGRDEVMMWAYQRPDGRRSFGFTGGHFHNNWGNDNFRKAVLNAMLWMAKAEVPENGVQSSVTPEELAANLDDKGKKPKP